MMPGLAAVLLSFGLLTTAPSEQAAAAPTPAQAEAAAKALQAAFIAGDVAAMKDHFADKLLFVGDPRFLGEDGRRQVQRELSRDQMMAAYTRLFDAMGRAEWRALLGKAQPSLTRATSDGTHAEDTTGILPPAFVKTGEYLFELRFPGTGLDDVILFVLRPVDGRWKVAAHWADY